MSAVTVSEQRKRIHPHKFTLWVGIGSIIMMFAGFTSAYIVKRNQPGFQTFELPRIFWYSTGVIIASSITMFLAVRSFKQRNISLYRAMLAITFVLGVLFIVMQLMGFSQMFAIGKTLKDVSSAFLYVIIGIHAAHVLGGIIALMVIFIKALSVAKKSYNSVPVELVSTYWHFVDILWIYLLIFLIMLR